MTRRERFFKRISDWRGITLREPPLEPEAMTRIIMDEVLGRPLRIAGERARKFLAEFRTWRAQLPPGTAVEIPAE